MALRYANWQPSCTVESGNTMTFFVTKSLATGPIRFGASTRRHIEAIDDDPGFSTGPDGAFRRRREESFFFADSRHLGDPAAPARRPPGRFPSFAQVLTFPKPFLALMAAGVLFILIGFAVVINKGGQGWVEVILGIIMIATPIVLTAQQRRAAREREERERAEREAREKREREMLASYTAALDKMRATPDAASLDAVRRERASLDLPYERWSNPARKAVLYIAFNALESGNLSRVIADASNAAGLQPEDEQAIRDDVYRTILWHLLADDRIGEAQSAHLEELRKELGVSEEESAVEQFQRLRGITPTNLPRAECSVQLGFHEYCIHATNDLFVTNKRLLLPKNKPNEVPLPKIDDVEVDADAHLLIIRAATLKKPLQLKIDDPIYTASLIDLATMLNERPRGFA